MRTLTLSRLVGSCVLMCGGNAAARPLWAQSSGLRVGDVARVSVTTPALTGLVGRVVAVTADSLTLQTDPPVARITISRAALTSAERRLRSSRVKHTLAGAVLGLLAGGAIGGITGAATAKPCSIYSDGFCGRGLGAAFGTMGGGALGLIAGTTIGLAMPVERWSPLKNLGLTLIPTRAVTSPELLIALHF